jgi:hypothetical protein
LVVTRDSILIVGLLGSTVLSLFLKSLFSSLCMPGSHLYIYSLSDRGAWGAQRGWAAILQTATTHVTVYI